MCGILAIIDPRRTGSVARHARRAEILLDRLAHRGPDGRDTLALPHAWLGHRRLAIVDPVGGTQPFRRDGVAWIANGEIFNHTELRAELGLTGISDSDCAVIGPAWQLFGSRLPERLDGQFSFVATDERTGHWIAARDHVGVCPLYFGRHTDGTLWFASEMKALVDDCVHVELVPPGYAWIGDAAGVRQVRWYDPAWQHEIPSTPADLERIRETLKAAVIKRLMSDVPWGLLLSGGLDSSLIAAIAVRHAREHGLNGGRPIDTFSIGLEGAPDLLAARQVARFLGTRHHEFTFTLDEALAAVPVVVRHLESYQQIRTGVPTYLLAKRIRDLGVKMVLSGEGADELLGGYLYFHRAPDAAEFHRETVRKVTRLHQFDVMRADKAPMAAGVEIRVPFLDREFVDLAMSLDPREKMIDPSLRPDGRRSCIEKYLLRKAFDEPRDPWLPDSILWRQKEQFSDGVGYGWVDYLREYADRRLPADAWEARERTYPEDTPATPELYWMRELFEQYFVVGQAESVEKAAGRSPLATVGTGRSIACSTPEALAWDPAWSRSGGDISGRMIAGVHTGAMTTMLAIEASTGERCRLSA